MISLCVKEQADKTNNMTKMYKLKNFYNKFHSFFQTVDMITPCLTSRILFLKFRETIEC